MSGRPVVAIVAEPGATRPLRGLVAALSRRVDVRAASHAGAPRAALAASPGAAERAPDGVPLAVLDGGALHVGGAEPIALPPGPTIATSSWPPLAPLVRSRWRERLGLPADLVVATTDLAPDDRPTALAVAAAAVVGGDDLPLALALGCPTVTDVDSAATVGATDGVHLVIGGLDDARALAADEHRCAELSRHGRALAVAALDPERTAERLLAAWGLHDADSPAARVDERLAELGTAPAAPVRHRVADALALFSPTGGP